MDGPPYSKYLVQVPVVLEEAGAIIIDPLRDRHVPDGLSFVGSHLRFDTIHQTCHQRPELCDPRFCEKGFDLVTYQFYIVL